MELLNGLDYLEIDSRDFDVAVLGRSNCDIVNRAVGRYMQNYFFDDVKPEDRDDPHRGLRKRLGSLKLLEIDKNFKCETFPGPGMDESYTIRVEFDPKTNNSSAKLQASTSWGIIRGLETFSQSVFKVRSLFYAIQPVVIHDAPRFEYRGFMLDTARHYISYKEIFKLLDAMSFNKLNVFHWHIVDDQSFPYASREFPELSAGGAFRPHLIYGPAGVRLVVRYAADRGIRVVPEFDTPGHTYSMRFIPDLLTTCYDKHKKLPDGNLGPINPIAEKTAETLATLFKEIKSDFQDPYFHAGGDEVDFDCWNSNPEVSAFMKAHNMTGRELSIFHFDMVHKILSKNSTVMVWQEVFDSGTIQSDDVIVQVWKDRGSPATYLNEMKKIVQSGHRAILSSCWYLNLIGYGQDWIEYYKCDPVGNEITDAKEQSLVLGGEVCQWSEFVDNFNVFTRSWPRASAAAERLWSPKNRTNVDEFAYRLEQIRCRMISRGMNPEPVNGPGYC